MKDNINPSRVRQGRFLWLPEPARVDYLRALKEKISDGFYNREAVLAQVADSLSPMYADTLQSD